LRGRRKGIAKASVEGEKKSPKNGRGGARETTA